MANGASSGAAGSVRGFHPVVALKRLGLDETAASPLAGSLDELVAADFPTIVLLRDGSALILLGRTDDGRYSVESLGGLAAVPHNVLERHYSGRRPACLCQAGCRPARRCRSPAPDRRGAGVSLRRIPPAAVPRAGVPSPAALLVASAASGVLGLAVPACAMAVLDRLMARDAVQTLAALAGGLGIALLLDLFARTVRNRLCEGMSAAVNLDISAWAFRHLVRVELASAPAGTGGGDRRIAGD